MLSLTIRCFTLALNLTLIYSTTIAGTEGKNTSSQHPLCQTVFCQCCIIYLFLFFLFLVVYLRSDKLQLFVYFLINFFSLHLQSSGLVDLLLLWPISKTPFGREGTALYPYINCITQAFASPICCGIPINNVWQKAARDTPGPLIWPFGREPRQKQTTPLDTRTQSNLVQSGWNKAFHFRVFRGSWFQLNTPTSGLVHGAWKEINGKGFNRLTTIGLIV